MPEKIVTVHMAAGNNAFMRKEDGHLPEDHVAPGHKGHQLRRSSSFLTSGYVSSHRSVNMIVSHHEIVNDQPPNVDTIPIDIEGESPLSRSIMVTAIIHIILGFASISTNVALLFAGTSVQVYLHVSGSSSEAPSYAIFVSEGLTIFIGIVLFISVVTESEFFFRIYPQVLWINVVLDLVAITYSAGGWRDLNTSFYERLFESKALQFYCTDKDMHGYKSVFDEDYKSNFWISMQKDMKCCGINGGIPGMDWVRICGRIPDSCCAQKKFGECKTNLSLWNAQDEAMKNISHIEHLLHALNCTNVLNLERGSLKRDYIIYPAVILFFDIVLMLSGNHFVQKYLKKCKSVEGRHELKLFRLRFRRKHTCCRKKNRVGPHDSDFELEPESVQGLQFANRLPYPAEFVTDRHSLFGLVKTADEQPGFAPDIHPNPPVTEPGPR